MMKFVPDWSLAIVVLLSATVGFLLVVIGGRKNWKYEKQSYFLLSYVIVSVVYGLIRFKVPIAFMWLKDTNIELPGNRAFIDEALVPNLLLLGFYSITYILSLIFCIYQLLKRRD